MCIVRLYIVFNYKSNYYLGFADKSYMFNIVLANIESFRYKRKSKNCKQNSITSVLCHSNVFSITLLDCYVLLFIEIIL